MFLLHGEAKYIDVLERALYNSAISGVALDGKTFFYPNPLASSGNYTRNKWFDCACCPTNICRFIPSIPGYAYATRDDKLYVNLFAASDADVELPSGVVHVEQITNFPWEGRVAVHITPEKTGQQFELRIRIPGWWSNSVLPGKLYTYLDERPRERFEIKLNGKDINSVFGDSGYAVIPSRAWQPGDVISFEMAMPVRRVIADEQVAADRGRVALMRGPIVYCIESPNLPPRASIDDLLLPDTEELRSEFRKDLLGVLQVITGVALRRHIAAEETRESAEGKANPKLLPITQEYEFTAIPYFAWANRGPSQMAVWLKRMPVPLKQNR
jgi:DUF1680 family protein